MTTNASDPYPMPEGDEERLALAHRLFREFHARCFWHAPRDLRITEELIPFVVRGLRTHGGRVGFLLAGRLAAAPADPRANA
jgi:hypothetical protein